MEHEQTSGGSADTTRWADRREFAASGLMLLACLLALAGAGLLSVMFIKLAVPTLFADTAFLSFGRLRPAAWSMLVYGFGGTLTHAIVYYLTPRLVGVALRHQTVALLSGVAHAGLVVVGVLVVLFRGPAGSELAEFPPLLDWPLAAASLVPALVVTSMIRERTEQGTYVSLLYIVGAVWWYPALYVTGSIPGLGGIGPFLQTSVVAGGMLTLAFPAAAIGGAYYIVVKESGRPLFSGPLARAGFWTLAGTALLATPARYLGGPAPDWTETVAVAASMGLALSALTVAANIGLTLSGEWETARQSVVTRMVLIGTIAYSLITFLIGASGFRSVAAVVGLTTWHDGLATGLMLVAIPVLGLAFVYYAFPRTTGRELSGIETVNRGLRLAVWGGGVAASAIAVAGLVAGLTWNWASASGARANSGSGFSETLAAVDVLFTLAALASVTAMVGIALLAWAAIGTYVAGPARAVEMLMPVTTTDRPGAGDE
ncbi:MAG: cbb3-type cytochrome c oxidase subunit I [bacterium]|nr:cbb3-type cytochrome c oxidase subunit I [bacterium]MDE0437598.1 cbb3-type cytochrome c oxidase subunit I [bacterium]